MHARREVFEFLHHCHYSLASFDAFLSELVESGERWTHVSHWVTGSSCQCFRVTLMPIRRMAFSNDLIYRVQRFLNLFRLVDTAVESIDRRQD